MTKILTIYPELLLTEAFIPTRRFRRDRQLRELEKLASIFNNRLPENVVLGRSLGTGKTIVARWMLDGYFADRSVAIHCWTYRSTRDTIAV